MRRRDLDSDCPKIPENLRRDAAKVRKNLQLSITCTKNYAFLPSGTLIVEPNAGLLAARRLLLAAADYYVPASNCAVVGPELCKDEVREAILSETLGLETLQKLASEIRLYWPKASIMLFGQVEMILDDHLYDVSIRHQCRPEELLNMLYSLEKMTRCATKSSCLRIGSSANGLREIEGMSRRSVPPESDPSKQPIPPSENYWDQRDVPRDEHGYPARL